MAVPAPHRGDTVPADPLSRLSAAERFVTHDCTRCGSPIPADAPPAAKVVLRTYLPMDPGPEWEAIGDWSDSLNALPGTLCDTCVEHLMPWLMAHRFPPAEPLPARVAEVLRQAAAELEEQSASGDYVRAAELRGRIEALRMVAGELP